MTGAEHLPLLQELLSQILGVPAAQVAPAASLHDDLGADCLDEVEMTLALERRLGILVPDDEAMRCGTVADWCGLVARRVALRPAEG